MRASGLLAAFFGLSLVSSTTWAAEVPAKPPSVPSGVEAHFDLEYARPGDKPQKLDLYVPKDVRGKVPVIIAIHGGGWTGGDKRQVPVIGLSTAGYAVASINYRFSGEAIFPAQIYDCKAAVRWLRAHAGEYHLDPDKFGAWGDSAGGHLVALLGTTANAKELEGDEGNPGFSSKVEAVCDFYGPADFQSFSSQKTPEMKSDPDAPTSALSKLIGGQVSQNQEKARIVSPVTYVDKTAAPFLIMHGDKDPLVPLAQSEELRDDLQKAGVEVELFVVKGAGHGFPKHPELAGKVKAFFDKHLKDSAATVSN